MAQPKTRRTGKSVNAFLRTIEDPAQRADCQALVTMMRDLTGRPPHMWGERIVGFGSYRTRYASGREVEWMITGFAPRKHGLSIYVMTGFDDYGALLYKLGPHGAGRSCLTVKRLEDVDVRVLRRLLSRSVEDMFERHDCA